MLRSDRASAGNDGVGRAESRPSRIGLISLDMKQMGERSAGNPHAAFDVAGAGNVARSRYLGRSRRASPRPYRRGGGWRRGMVEIVGHSQTKGRDNREPKLRPKPARQSSTLPMAVSGTFETCRLRWEMSAFRGNPEDNCSHRVLLSLTRMYGPAARCKRFRQPGRCGLASMYPASDWSVLCSGPSWISARIRAD